MAESSNLVEGFVDIVRKEIEECKVVMDTEGVKGYECFLQKKAHEWKNIPLNIGIIGNSGAGKSSFINGVRNLNGDDEGAAPVDSVQCTMKPTPYSHPDNEMMKFWDLPGVGTPDYPKDSYLKKIEFEKFDFFLILSHTRFTENDSWIAQEIAKNGKSFFFLRTKIHMELENDRKAHPKKYKENRAVARTQLLSKIREDIKNNLGNLYDEKHVFLVDNYERNQYDFDLLQQRLVEDFPQLKRQAFIFSLNAVSERMVEMKIKELKSTILKCSAFSGVVAMVPLPGLSFAVDLAAIISCSKFMYDQLGLDDRSLEKLAKATQSDAEELKSIVKGKIDSKKFFTSQGIKEICVSLPMIGISELAEEGLRFLPVLGALIAAPISFGTTYYILKEILKVMGDTAFQVVRVAAENASRADDEQYDDEAHE